MQNLEQKLLINCVIFCGFCLSLVLCVPKCNNCTVISRIEFQNLTTESFEWSNLVPKCCGITQWIAQLPGQKPFACAETDDDWEFAPLLWKANNTGIRSYYYSSLTVVVGNPCTYGKYPLEPYVNDKDKYYIFDNGKVYLPQDNLNMVDINSFCLDYHRPENADKNEITPFLCIEEVLVLAEKPMYGTVSFYFFAFFLFISALFLLCTFLFYVCIPKLNDTHGKCLACHALSLGIAFLFLDLVQLFGEQFPKFVCIIFAYTIEFFFLCCFFWLNIMFYDSWHNVMYHLDNGTTEAKETKLFVFYSLYAWSIPFIIIIITPVKDLILTTPSKYLKPNFGLISCWFNSDDAALKYFCLPVGVLIVINMAFHILTLKRLVETVQDINRLVDPNDPNELARVLDMKMRWQKYKNNSRLCLILLLIIICMWIIEIVFWYSRMSSVVSIVNVINALQGVFIFLIYVYQKPVRNILLLKMRKP